MASMASLTKKQEAVRKFIADELAAARPCPTSREIAAHFKFASKNAADCHIKALIEKGVLMSEAGKSRSLSLVGAIKRSLLVEIPLFGSIPAGYGEDREQEPDGFVSVDITTIGFKPSRNTFALRVTGDSMIGKHICDGDIVILDHGGDPRNGEVVAALIDRKATLKTFVQKGGKRYLKAENPKYPNLIPSEDLMIQGVFKGLIRKA